MITIHDQGSKQFYSAGGSDVISDIDSNFTELSGDISAINVPVKATGLEITAGTDDTKFATPKALADALIVATPSKANGGEINAGTDDAKFATPKSIADSNIAFISDIPVKATGAEINTGTDDAKFATAKAIADSNLATETYVDSKSFSFSYGSDIIIASNDSQERTSLSTYTKIKEFTLSSKHTSSSANISFNLVYVPNGDAGATVFGRIYKNGVATGTERSGGNSTNATYEEEIACSSGDLIQIYAKVTGATSAEAGIQNFRILGKLDYATIT